MDDAIPTEQLYELRSITQLTVSPDGERIAFIASEFEPGADERHASIFTVPADGSEAPFRLTRVSDASTPRFSPDGSKLGFLAERDQDIDRRVGVVPEDEDDENENGGNGNDDDTKTQVWAFDLERGGDAVQLTDREHGVREFDWGPDGERIVITARDPTEEQEEYLDQLEDDGPVEIERLQHKMDGVGYTDDVLSYLFVVDVDTGEEKRLDAAYGEGAFEPLRGLHPRWNPHSEEIAFVTCREERPDDSAVSDVFTVNAETGKRTRLTDEQYGMMLPDWSPDGSKLTFSGRFAVNWYLPAEVFLLDHEDHDLATLSDDLDATVSWFGFPQFTDTDTILAGMGDRGWTRFYRFDTDGSAPTPVDLDLGRDESLRFFDVGGSTLAYSVTNPQGGHDIRVVDLDAIDADDPPTRQVTDLNQSFIEAHPMPNVTRVETDHEDATVESILYYPDSFDPDDPTPHPLIMWMHGGPASYDDPEFSFDFAYFTSRGYLICKPNYRGSTSYGADFGEVLYAKWGTVEVDDILAVTDDLVDRGWADGDRLFSTGFSYGGIATGFVITSTDRFTAAAAEHGIYDLRTDFSVSDSQVWMGSEFGLPWEDYETYEEGSSINDVGGVTTPTLITAGEQDWRCHPGQSEQLYVSLRKQGVPAKFVLYRNEHHAVTKPERMKHRLEEISSWFERFDPAVEATD